MVVLKGFRCLVMSFDVYLGWPDFSMNLSLLNTTVSGKVSSFSDSDILAVTSP